MGLVNYIILVTLFKVWENCLKCMEIIYYLMFHNIFLYNTDELG